MRIFIGWDSREDIAYQVCRRSLLNHSSIPLEITPIKQHEMRDRNLYWREKDPLSSTDFTFTRFLTPYLAGYSGWALFCDCDFLFRRDIASLQEYCDNSYAVRVVKHNYKPKEETKMDGQAQTQYPRKNWSSFMLINCGHSQVRNHLTLKAVNIATGMYLHRLKWVDDEFVGELPIAYNYLEGWYSKKHCADPVAVHFTRGGPWFQDYMDVEYGDEWVAIQKEVLRDGDTG